MPLMTTACTTRAVVWHMIRAVPSSHSRLHKRKLNSRGLCTLLCIDYERYRAVHRQLAESPPPHGALYVLIGSDRQLVGLRVFIKSISLSTKFTLSRTHVPTSDQNKSTLLFSGKRAQASVESSIKLTFETGAATQSKSHEGWDSRFYAHPLNCFEFASHFSLSPASLEAK